MSIYEVKSDREAEEQTRDLIRRLIASQAIGEGEFDFNEVEVAAYPFLAGRALRELDLPHTADIIVISVISSSGEQTFSPPAKQVIEKDDVLRIVCREDGLQRLEAMRGE